MIRAALAGLVLLSVAVALSACAGADAGAGAPPPAEPLEPDAVTEPAPAAPPEPSSQPSEPAAETEEAWPATPSCGRYERGNEPLQSAAQKAGNRCIIEAARKGEPAQLIATYTTIEGDPITNYVRVLADGRVDIYVDATQDAFGSGMWEHYLCTELSVEGGYLGWSGCDQTSLDTAPAGLPEP